MTDLISRKEAIDALEDTKQSDPFDRYEKQNIGIEWAIDVLKELPSAEPDIIRCRECKHSEHWYRDRRRCFLWSEDGASVFDDGFCNYAERREE